MMLLTVWVDCRPKKHPRELNFRHPGRPQLNVEVKDGNSTWPDCLVVYGTISPAAMVVHDHRTFPIRLGRTYYVNKPSNNVLDVDDLTKRYAVQYSRLCSEISLVPLSGSKSQKVGQPSYAASSHIVQLHVYKQIIEFAGINVYYLWKHSGGYISYLHHRKRSSFAPVTSCL
jgi:hypothetical protein